MVPKASPDPRSGQAILLVGPGARARDLGLVLKALGAPHGVPCRTFEDVADLAAEDAHVGLLLLDADAIPLEDVGYVRRFAESRPKSALVLFGGDARARTVRVLGPRRFAHWPLDVEELSLFVEDAGGQQNARNEGQTRNERPAIDAARRDPMQRDDARPPTAGVSTTQSYTSPAEDDELEQVRAILAAESDTLDPVRSSSLHGAFASTLAAPTVVRSAATLDHTDVDVSDFEPAFAEDDESTEMRSEAEFESESDATALATHDVPTRPAIAAPPWWRAQVADLADAAQRIDLSVKMLAQSAPEIDEGDMQDARGRLRELEAEVARLLQFTRTLGYVAAPPPTGSQTFDFGEIVHLFATGLAQSGPEAPRCQFKTTPSATVRSDRQLLSQALDAIFFLVRCTARKGDLVRARVHEVAGEAAGDTQRWIELDLDFPSGPLEGFTEEDVVAPYSLTELFPELGPNALAAASGIATGQGGELRLLARARQRMTWRLRLPRSMR